MFTWSKYKNIKWREICVVRMMYLLYYFFTYLPAWHISELKVKYEKEYIVFMDKIQLFMPIAYFSPSPAISTY